MIPKAYIEQWKQHSSWRQDEFVEQDLILSRLLVELYTSKTITNTLAFRGGTALHKLFLKHPYRYSEDLDFVQIKAGDIGSILTELRRITSRIITNKPKHKKSKNNNTLTYSYEAENPPNPRMKIKIEINTREHFAVDGVRNLRLECNSDWFEGTADIVTFSTEELLATKLRALYQRSKGRDLFDLWIARELNPVFEKTIRIFKTYLDSDNLRITKKEYAENLRNKIEDSIFQNDIKPIIRNSMDYNLSEAYEYVRDNYINLM